MYFVVTDEQLLTTLATNCWVWIINHNHSKQTWKQLVLIQLYSYLGCLSLASMKVKSHVKNEHNTTVETTKGFAIIQKYFPVSEYPNIV